MSQELTHCPWKTCLLLILKFILSAITITWTNVDQFLQCYIASPGPSETGRDAMLDYVYTEGLYLLCYCVIEYEYYHY